MEMPNVTQTAGQRAIASRRADRAAGLTSEESVVKELTTKLAWAVGSTLHVGYSRTSPLRRQLGELAQTLYNRKLDYMDFKR